MHILNWFGELISTYWLDLVLILIAISTVIVLIRKGVIRKSSLFKLAQLAVAQAERYYKTEAGQIKKQEAIKWLKEHSLLARIVSDAQIDIIVEEAWTWLDEQLELQEAKQKEKEADSSE